MSIMGIVRLAPGNIGYFDEITRIHLTLSLPQKEVIEGMNTTGLKKAVRNRTLQLVSGSLDPETKVLVKTTDVKPAAPVQAMKLGGEEATKSETLKEVAQDGMQDQEDQKEDGKVIVDGISDQEGQEAETVKGEEAPSDDESETDAEEHGLVSDGQEEVTDAGTKVQEKQVRKTKKRK